MRRAFLLVLISAAVMLMACQKATPTPEAVVEEVPPLELSAEVRLEVGDLGELDLGTLLAGSEELGLEGPAMPELEAATSPDVVFDLEFDVEGAEP